MASSLGTLLQLVLSLLLLVRNNPSLPGSQVGQIVSAATEAVQTVEEGFIHPSSSSSVIAGWNTYSDQSGEFMFQYPTADAVSTSSDSSLSYFFVNPTPGFQFVASIGLSSTIYQYDAADPNDGTLWDVDRATEIYKDTTAAGLENCETDQAEASTSEGQINLPGVEGLGGLFPQTTTVDGVIFYLTAGTGAPGMSQPIVYGVGYQTLHNNACWKIDYLSQQGTYMVATGSGYPVLSASDSRETAAADTYLQIFHSFRFGE